VYVLDGVEWYLSNRKQLVQKHGADFAIAINGLTGDCVIRRSAAEAERAYLRAHPKVPPTLIITGAA
jgi:hypothetical protein